MLAQTILDYNSTDENHSALNIIDIRHFSHSATYNSTFQSFDLMDSSFGLSYLTPEVIDTR